MPKYIAVLIAALVMIGSVTTARHVTPAHVPAVHAAAVSPPIIFDPHPAPVTVSRSAPITLPPSTTSTTAPPPPPPSTTTTAPTTTTTTKPSGYTTACYPSVGMAPRNRTEACISSREHGGCYDRSNNAYHFGRWQFDRDTWTGNGGNPAHWGYASPAEQDAAFRHTVTANGYGQWTRYDGC